jgi:hypothetical protein
MGGQLKLKLTLHFNASVIHVYRNKHLMLKVRDIYKIYRLYTLYSGNRITSRIYTAAGQPIFFVPVAFFLCEALL